MYDEPIKFTKAERKAGAHIRVPDFTKGNRPKPDPDRKVYNYRCAFCGYKAQHRLYVCPTCGCCQACAANNPTGNVNQACQVCANGANVPDLPIPEVVTGARHDEPILISRESQEVEPHNKKQSSASVNVTNIQTIG